MPTGQADNRTDGGYGVVVADLETERLIMRDWRESDLPAWAAMNTDPEVRRYVGATLSYEQSAAWALTFQDHLDRYGYTFWALETRSSGEFVGFAGLMLVDDDVPASPAVEIGWRLARPVWGQGYATEAAAAALAYGFDVAGLTEIIAMIADGNTRSRDVARRLGMVHEPARDFVDPDAIEVGLEHYMVYVKRSTPPSYRVAEVPGRFAGDVRAGVQVEFGQDVRHGRLDGPAGEK